MLCSIKSRKHQTRKCKNKYKTAAIIVTRNQENIPCD